MGDPTRIISTGFRQASSVDCLQKNWKWPAYAKHKPEAQYRGLVREQPFLPKSPHQPSREDDPPGFVMYGGKDTRRSRQTRARHSGRLKKNKVWSKMVYIDFMGQIPPKHLFSPQSRTTHSAYGEFLDFVYTGRKSPGAEAVA